MRLGLAGIATSSAGAFGGCGTLLAKLASAAALLAPAALLGCAMSPGGDALEIEARRDTVEHASESGGERVLVTGASGFIGTAVVGRLRAAGVETHAISRRPPENGASGVRWWAADLTDPAATDEVVRRVRPDTIIHLAGSVDSSRAIDIVPSTLAVNLGGTVNLLTAAVRHDSPRVLLSASMEEPDAPGDWSPGSPYAASKLGASAYGRLFHDLYGLPVTSLRPFLCYGPGQQDQRKLIPYVVRSMLCGEEAQVGSGGRPIDWVYVDDVADAFVAATTSRGIDGRMLDVGTGRLTTAREVVESIHAKIESAPPPRFGAMPDRPLERPRAADVETTARVLGWRARTGLDEGLARTIAAQRAALLAEPSLGSL